jgi:hypothetical protein
MEKTRPGPKASVADSHLWDTVRMGDLTSGLPAYDLRMARQDLPFLAPLHTPSAFSTGLSFETKRSAGMWRRQRASIRSVLWPEVRLR